MKKDGILSKILPHLKKDKNVLAVYLFGSQARGEKTPMSDLDLAVFLEKGSRKASAEVSSFSSPYVDVVVFNDAPPYLKYEIMKEGKPLFVRDKEKLEDEINFAIIEYLDHVPMYKRFGLIRGG